jgi:hypothetical protein
MSKLENIRTYMAALQNNPEMAAVVESINACPATIKDCTLYIALWPEADQKIFWKHHELKFRI